MPGQSTYVELPNGSYVEVPEGASAQDMAAFKTKLQGMNPEPPKASPTTMSAGPAPSMGSRVYDWAEGHGMVPPREELANNAKQLGEIALEEGGLLVPEVAATKGASGMGPMARATKSVIQHAPTMMAGAYEGAKYGSKAGGALGKPFGMETLGEGAGAALGGVTGAIAGPKLQDAAMGVLGRIAGWGQKAAPVMEETASPVLRPEPRPQAPGEPNLAGSIPRAELEPLAKAGHPGAATQEQALGRRVLYEPSGTGIQGSRAGSKMTFPEEAPTMKSEPKPERRGGNDRRGNYTTISPESSQPQRMVPSSGKYAVGDDRERMAYSLYRKGFDQLDPAQKEGIEFNLRGGTMDEIYSGPERRELNRRVAAQGGQ